MYINVAGRQIRIPKRELKSGHSDPDLPTIDSAGLPLLQLQQQQCQLGRQPSVIIFGPWRNAVWEGFWGSQKGKREITSKMRPLHLATHSWT